MFVAEAGADTPLSCVVDLLDFQHGVHSPGSVTPDDLGRIVRRHGATPWLLAIR